MNYNLVTCCAFLILLLNSSCSYLPEPYLDVANVSISETAEYILLESEASASSQTLFLYYPGGLVDPHAYITMLSGVVQAGYPVVLMKVTANLAITNVGKARKIREEFSNFEYYVLGGHSLGAAVTCIAASRDLELYDGLVVMAGYPTENASLEEWEEGTILVFDATDDEVIDRSKLEEARPFFPAIEAIFTPEDLTGPTTGKTIWVEVAGGNHSQYGDYGFQKGDGEATISTQEQHAFLNDYMLKFFKVNDW